MVLQLTGVANAILKNIKTIAGMNDPQTKITPVGYLRMLLENNAMVHVNNLPEVQAGKNVDIDVRYMQRGIESEVSDKDNCDTDVTPAWKSTKIGKPKYNKISIFISDEDMATYSLAADDPVQLGDKAVSVSRALYETVMTHVNALLQKIDGNLVAEQATKWGVNAATGNSNATQIKLTEDITMTDGIVKLVLDSETNEVNDQLLICGNGLVRAFDIYNSMKTGVDNKGFGALNLRTYADPKTTGSWGVNHFGVFAKGTVGFVDICKYRKNSGERGTSHFFTMPMPVLLNGQIIPIDFDCQLKYADCPVYDDNGDKVGDRGWLLTISKTYGLFNLPSDCFKAGDPLAGVNGSFHYVVNNA